MIMISRPFLWSRLLLVAAALAPSSGLTADEVVAPADRLRAAAPVPGSALDFNLLRLQIPDEPAISFDEDDSFTIEGWFRVDGFTAGSEALVAKDGSYAIRRDGTTNRLAFATNRGVSFETLPTAAAVPIGAWFHLAAVYDGASRTKRLFLDGVPQGTQVITKLQTSGNPFLIGGSINGSNHFNGAMDGLRLWNVARSPAQIMGDMDRDLTGFDFVTSTADRSVAGLLAEWRFNGLSGAVVPDSSGAVLRNATVATGSINAGSFTGGLAFRPAPPLAAVATSALGFPGGADSQVTVADHPLLNPTGAITLEAWVLVDAFSQPSQAIVSKGDGWGLTRHAGTSRIAFRTSHAGVVDVLPGMTELLPSRWVHVAGTFDGQDKRLYIDGILDAKAPVAGALDTGADDLVIGGAGFAGKVDNVRLWARARDAGQIEEGRWTDLRGFENGLRGDWRFDGESGPEAVDNSYVHSIGTLGATVTRVDGLAQVPLAAPVADIPPPAGGALYFPADLAMKSSFVLPNDPLLDPLGALTIEAWISVSSLTGKTQGIVTKGISWGLLLDDATRKLIFRTRRAGQYSDLAGGTALEFDRWYHVAAVFDGSSKSIYLDGELDGSAASVGALEGVDALESDLLGRVAFSGNYDGTSEQSSFHGRLDGVRLWSVARGPAEIVAGMTRELRGTESGLLGAWRFDGADPTLDASRHQLHGMVGGTPAAFAPMQVDGLPFDLPLDGALALEFNWRAGAADCVNLTAAPEFDFTTGMTVELWLHVDGLPAPGESFALASKGGAGWELSLEPNGKINFRTPGVTLDDTLDEDNLPKPGTPFPDFLSTNRIEPGGWYHIAAVWDGSGASGRKEIHLNGQLDNSRDDLAGAIDVSSGVLLLGARPLDPAAATTANHLAGTLDEVRLWEIPVSGGQIRASFDNRLFGDELGLVGYWPFSQGGRNPDRSESLSVDDEAGGLRTPIDGMMCPGMGILNRVSGVPLGDPAERQYALRFNGTDEYLTVPADPSFEGPGDSLTIEAWVNPAGGGFRTIVMQGDHGYGLAIDQQNRLRFFHNGSAIGALASTGTVANGVWQHVAVVVDGAAGTTTFFIDGRPAGSVATAQVVVKPGQPLVIGRQGPYGGNYYRGLLDELRVWFSARTPTEVEFFALQPLASGELPGLAGYWQFNEGRGTVGGSRVPGGPDGMLTNMDDSNWQPGHAFPSGSIDGSLNLSPVAGSEGLWMGTIVLDSVNEVQTAVGGASNTPSPTGDTLTARIILHADAGGAVRLLKDVIVMRTPPDAGDPGAPRRLVLLTDPLLIPSFEGVVERGGRLVGQRFGTVDYDFDGRELVLLGGIGPGADVAGKITLGRDHPTNPFRHKYHPQHGRGFEIIRQFSISFDTAPADPATAAPGFGSEWITGEYRETIAGLHKIPLKTGGRIELHRINDTGTLNDR